MCGMQPNQFSAALRCNSFRTAVAAILIAIGMVLELVSASASAHEGLGCQGACCQWWLDCAKRTGVSASAIRCGNKHVIGVVGEGEHAVMVDISRWSDRSFRRVGSFGVSPIGEFADWYAEPEQRIRAFDALLSCLEAADFGTVMMGQNGRENDDAEEMADARLSMGTKVPWLLIGAACALLMAAFQGRQLRLLRFWWNRVRTHRCVGWVRDGLMGRGLIGLGAMLGLVAVVFVARLVWMPMLFFHPNGQGPL